MRRKIAAIALIIVCYILQYCVFPMVAGSNISPNLILAAVVSIALVRGEKPGILTGFFGGLLVDLFFGSMLGFYALLYMTLGYLSGMFQKFFDADRGVTSIAWIAVMDFLCGAGIYVLRFLLRSRFEFKSYLLHIILPEVLFTGIVSFVLYFSIRRVSRWLNQWDEDYMAGYGEISATTAAALEQAENIEEL